MNLPSISDGGKQMKCETIRYLIDDDVLNASKNYPVRTLVK
jgi:hypothetical protein